MVLVVSPLVMFLGNQEQYGSLRPLLVTLAIAFVIGTAVLLLLLGLVRARPGLRQLVVGGLIGLALGAWVQGQLLVWDLGPLDGRGLDWDAFKRHGYLEIAVWVFVVAGTVALFIKRSRLTHSLPSAAWLLGAVSLVASFIGHGLPGSSAESAAPGTFPTVQEAL